MLRRLAQLSVPAWTAGPDEVKHQGCCWSPGCGGQAGEAEWDSSAHPTPGQGSKGGLDATQSVAPSATAGALGMGEAHDRATEQAQDALVPVRPAQPQQDPGPLFYRCTKARTVEQAELEGVADRLLQRSGALRPSVKHQRAQGLALALLP